MNRWFQKNLKKFGCHGFPRYRTSNRIKTLNGMTPRRSSSRLDTDNQPPHTPDKFA
ncbi:hypothetical protein RRSWK_02033 [Rhodopirellula sp. SWK7]|nr:hypothetical protein RRSWK_02033 [Rhodopirellula sp. SWK7]